MYLNLNNFLNKDKVVNYNSMMSLNGKVFFPCTKRIIISFRISKEPLQCKRYQREKSCLIHFSFLKFALFAAVAAAVVYYIVKCQTTFFFECRRKMKRILFKSISHSMACNKKWNMTQKFTLISFFPWNFHI